MIISKKIYNGIIKSINTFKAEYALITPLKIIYVCDWGKVQMNSPLPELTEPIGVFPVDLPQK